MHESHVSYMHSQVQLKNHTLAAAGALYRYLAVNDSGHGGYKGIHPRRHFAFPGGEHFGLNIPKIYDAVHIVATAMKELWHSNVDVGGLLIETPKYCNKDDIIELCQIL